MNTNIGFPQNIFKNSLGFFLQVNEYVRSYQEHKTHKMTENVADAGLHNPLITVIFSTKIIEFDIICR